METQICIYLCQDPTGSVPGLNWQTDAIKKKKWVRRVSACCKLIWPFHPSSASPPSTYLSHDGDGRLPFRLGHSVLDQVVHVLVVQQADQVERPETGGAPQGQISDHHWAGEQRELNEGGPVSLFTEPTEMWMLVWQQWCDNFVNSTDVADTPALLTNTLCYHVGVATANHVPPPNAPIALPLPLLHPRIPCPPNDFHTFCTIPPQHLPTDKSTVSSSGIVQINPASPFWFYLFKNIQHADIVIRNPPSCLLKGIQSKAKKTDRN